MWYIAATFEEHDKAKHTWELLHREATSRHIDITILRIILYEEMASRGIDDMPFSLP